MNEFILIINDFVNILLCLSIMLFLLFFISAYRIEIQLHQKTECCGVDCSTKRAAAGVMPYFKKLQNS